MNIRVLKYGYSLAAGILAFLLVSGPAVNAQVIAFTSGGSIKSCAQAAAKLNALPAPFTFSFSENPGDWLFEAKFKAKDITSNDHLVSGSNMDVRIQDFLSSGQTRYDFVVDNAIAPAERGTRVVDFAVGVSGNGETNFVYFPDRSSGSNIRDVNTTSKLGSGFVCGDNIDEAVTQLETCGISGAALDRLCESAGEGAVVNITNASSTADPQQCVCPGGSPSGGQTQTVTDQCDPAPPCDPNNADPDLWPNGCPVDTTTFCKWNPNDGNALDPDTNLPCCFIHPVTGKELKARGVAKGWRQIPGHGSDPCVISFNTGTEILTFRICNF